MFTKRTTVVTSGGKMPKSFDKLMDKGAELLDAGMKVLDEAFSGDDEKVDSVSTTIRIRLSPQQVTDFLVGKTLQFRADGTTILIEKGRE